MKLARITLLPVLFVLVASLSNGQNGGIANGGFEDDRTGSAPAGWFLPKPCSDAGYQLDVTDSSAAQGKHSAELHGAGANDRMFGNCMQSVDATPFRGKRVRF